MICLYSWISNNLAKYIYFYTWKRKLKFCETWFDETKDLSSISVYVRRKEIYTSRIKWKFIENLSSQICTKKTLFGFNTH